MCNRKRKSFIKGTGLVTLSRISAIVAGAVAGILTARYLGPDGKGRIALALGTGTILGHFLYLGFDQAAPYFLASGKLKDNKVLGSGILAVVVGTVIAFAVVYPLFTGYLMNSVFSGVSKSLLVIAGLSCPLYLLRLLVNSILTGHEDFSRRTCHDILIYLAVIFSAVLGLAVLGVGPLGYAEMQIGAGFFTLTGGFILLGRVIKLRPVFSLSAWLKMLRYGIKSALTQVFNLIDLRLDIFVVNYFTEISVVGIYTVAAGLANLFWILPYSVSIVLLPRNASSSLEEANKRTAAVCRNVLWLTVISAGLFLLVAKWFIVVVYTGLFADAAFALTLLMPGVVGFAVSRICYTDCSARGHPEKATYSTAITAILTIVFDLCLIPRYGIYGAAIASSIAYCTGGILGLSWHIKLSGNHLSSLIIPRKDDLKYYRLLLSKMRTKVGG